MELSQDILFLFLSIVLHLVFMSLLLLCPSTACVCPSYWPFHLPSSVNTQAFYTSGRKETRGRTCNAAQSHITSAANTPPRGEDEHENKAINSQKDPLFH
ncbi:hypothetical protein V8C42DRAFT_325409 [Trichoderma barbatum]